MIILAGMSVSHGGIVIIDHIAIIITHPITGTDIIQIGIGITPIMIHIGVIAHGIPIIMVITGLIIIQVIEVDIGLEITTGIIINTITAINAIGIAVEAILETETAIATRTIPIMITDIQKECLIR
jgi:hypothetical protein